MSSKRTAVTSHQAAVALRIAALRTAHPQDGYLAYHTPRYKMLLNLLADYVGSNSRVLDVGRSRFTDLIAETFEISVDSLGLEPDGLTRSGRHYHFDLNDSQLQSRWRTDLKPYDIIVLAEVIEHVRTAPTLVLQFLRTVIEDGGVLIIQTPNAAALHKRIKLLLGRNPYELIRENTSDPGHFREYTQPELSMFALKSGFAVSRCVMGNYFDYQFSDHDHDRLTQRPWLQAVNYAYSILPRTLRPGITTVMHARGT